MHVNLPSEHHSILYILPVFTIEFLITTGSNWKLPCGVFSVLVILLAIIGMWCLPARICKQILSLEQSVCM